MSEQQSETDESLSEQEWLELTHLLRVLARESGIQLQFPRRPEGSLEQVLQSISQHSDVPIHKVRLGPGWHRMSNTPMLCTSVDESSSESAQIAAVFPSSHGCWVVHGGSPDRTRLSRRLRRSLSQHAWMLVPTFSNTSAQPSNSESLGIADLFRFGARMALRQRWLLIAAVACSVLFSFVPPIALKQVIDVALPVVDEPFLWSILALLLAFNITQAFIHFARSISVLIFQFKATEAMQAALWSRILRLPVSFFSGQSSGDIVHRSMLLSTASWTLGNSVLHGGIGAMVALFSGVLALWLSPKLLLLAIPLSLLEAAIQFFLVIRIRIHKQRLETHRAALTGDVSGWMQGILKIRATGVAPQMLDAAAQKNDAAVQEDQTLQFLEDVRGLTSIVVPAMCTLVVFAFGFEMSIGAGFTVGAFAAFIAAYRSFAVGIGGLANLLADLIGIRAQLRLIEPFLNTTPEVYRGRTNPGVLEGDVSFENVSFAYPRSTNTGLNQVNFMIRRGERVGLFGKSGSGKSSIVRLLLGLEQPQHGRILLDGINIQSLDMQAARRSIGCVLQSDRLISGSIRDNVQSGRTLTDDEIFTALELAEIKDEVDNMPLGLGTMISQGGTNVSGGQAQRLLLARAIAHRPNLLVLDESLSGLDVGQQQRILKRLEQLRISVLMISHRMDALAGAARLYRMEAGRIIEVGETVMH